MSSSKQQFTVDQGTDKTIVLKVWQNSAQTVPQDITGYTAEMRVADDYTQSAKIVLNMTNGVSVNASTSEVIVDFEPSDTMALFIESNEYIGVCQIDIKSPFNKITRIADGKITIKKKIP